MQRRRRTPRISKCDTENGGARNWSKLPTSEWDRIIDLYEARDSIALAREAQQLGTSVSTLERQIRHAILIRDRYRQKYLAESIPESQTPVYDEYHVIQTNDAIIISDLEVPDHDVWMLKAALLTGMRFGIYSVIFAGDLIATDQDALNTWLSTWAEDGEHSYSADLDELRTIIRRFQEWFTDGITMVMGNHDLRIDKKTGGQVTLEMLLDDTEMQFSRYSYMYVWMPKAQEWVYVCHQFNYSKTSVKLAQDVWQVVSAPDGYSNATGERIPEYDEWRHGKNKQKCHVIVTHTHVAQDGFSPDGNWPPSAWAVCATTSAPSTSGRGRPSSRSGTRASSCCATASFTRSPSPGPTGWRCWA